MPGKPPLSNDAKVAEAIRRRNQQTAVRLYLEALEERSISTVRNESPERLQARLEKVRTDLVTATSVERVLLLQTRLDLEARLAMEEVADGFDELERAFVAVAAEWARRKGVSYAALRTAGVPAGVLRAAGIRR